MAEGPKGLRIGGIICYDGGMCAICMHDHFCALTSVTLQACMDW